MKRGDVKIDPVIADKLRKFAFNKHGTLRGCMKLEAERAILNHLKKEGAI